MFLGKKEQIQCDMFNLSHMMRISLKGLIDVRLYYDISDQMDMQGLGDIWTFLELEVVASGVLHGKK